MFRFRTAKRSIRRSKEAKEILNRVQKYLDSDTDELVRIMQRHWKDEETVITYADIRNMVLYGGIDESLIQLWQRDYAALVTRKLDAEWKKGIIAGSHGQPILDEISDNFRFDIQRPYVIDWISNHGAEFVTNCTNIQKDGVQTIIRDYIYGGYSPDELSKVIRPCIGLTKGQSDSVVRLYNNAKKRIREEHPRMKERNVENKAKYQAERLAERLHRQRAFTIAQSEMCMAYGFGAHASVKQAQADGYLGEMEKIFCTSGDANVCNDCAALNGQRFSMDAEIPHKGKKLSPEMYVEAAYLHPRCACQFMYVEKGGDW